MTEISREYSASAYIVHDHKVLLVHNKKLDLWLCPGGHLQRNELPHIGVKREVREETGLGIELFPNDDETDLDGAVVLPQPDHLILFRMWPGHEVVNFSYFATAKTAQVRPHQGELHDYKWATLSELDTLDLPKNTRLYAKMAIEAIDAKRKRG